MARRRGVTARHEKRLQLPGPPLAQGGRRRGRYRSCKRADDTRELGTIGEGSEGDDEQADDNAAPHAAPPRKIYPHRQEIRGGTRSVAAAAAAEAECIMDASDDSMDDSDSMKGVDDDDLDDDPAATVGTGPGTPQPWPRPTPDSRMDRGRAARRARGLALCATIAGRAGAREHAVRDNSKNPKLLREQQRESSVMTGV
jgi:hypothetical protein